MKADQVREIIARHFGASDGELKIGGIPVGTLASTYGTPFFAYDAAILDRQLALLRETYPAAFSISYSVKANPCPAVVRHFVGLGLGLEIASAGEFDQALRAGCRPEKILFAGPGKTDRELEFVLSGGIGEIHAESILEVQRIRAISKKLGLRARVALRVNPGGDVQGGAMRMGGKPAPFGVDEERLEAALEHLKDDDLFHFQGIHLFTGTQILDPDVLIGQYRRGVEIARRVADRIGRPLETVDFGGGLGIPYFPSEAPLDMARVKDGLTTLATEIAGDRRFHGTQLLIEPGRYLVGESGVYIARITDIKESRGKTFLVLDGGMNHHLAASGNLGQVIKRNFPLAVLNRLGDAPAGSVDVVGPLCTPLDILAREASLPSAQVGDLVGIFQSGAYARSASPLGFLSQPTPPEVFILGGEATLARRRGTFDDAFRDVP